MPMYDLGVYDYVDVLDAAADAAKGEFSFWGSCVILYP